MEPRAIVGGLGLPGQLLSLALLRQGYQVTACDPKRVHTRTLARVYGLADVGTLKTDALNRAAEVLGCRGRLTTRAGRLEDVIGGGEVLAADLVLLAADRPTVTWRAAELCARIAAPAHPLTLITCNVGGGAAQVRAFRFPLEGAACPLCGAGAAYLASLARDSGFSCEAGGDASDAGDQFTVPFGLAEGYTAAGLALSALAGPAGNDTTLALAQPPQLLSSRLLRDPDCPLGCAAISPWPAPAGAISAAAPLAQAVATAASHHELRAGGLSLQFLRPVALGLECGCGRRDGLAALRTPCAACATPVVPLRGAGQEFPLDVLREYAPASSAVSMGLPARDLICVTDATGRHLALTVQVGGACHA